MSFARRPEVLFDTEVHLDVPTREPAAATDREHGRLLPDFESQDTAVELLGFRLAACGHRELDVVDGSHAVGHLAIVSSRGPSRCPYREVMSVTAAFSITPLGGSAVDEDGSVGSLIADVVRIVRESGLPNETNAMFTNVEGSLEDVLALIGRCVEHVTKAAPRASVVVKLDVRPGRKDALHEKVASIERRLGGG